MQLSKAAIIACICRKIERDVPWMLRSAVSAFTRVFDAVGFAAWCAADPGSIGSVTIGPGSAEQRYTLHRVRDTKRDCAAIREACVIDIMEPDRPRRD